MAETAGWVRPTLRAASLIEPERMTSRKVASWRRERYILPIKQIDGIKDIIKLNLYILSSVIV
jgi:hypothetical protein